MPDQGQSVLTQLWEATTKLSESAIDAARSRAEPLGLDKGSISFNETRINLIHARDVIADAVDNQKLIQLPLSIQSALLNLVNQTVGHLTAMANGADEVILLVDKVEQLSVFLWTNGFYNLSKEVLGYQEKVNKLKAMQLEAEELIKELKASEKLQKSSAHVARQIEDLRQAGAQRIEELSGAKKQSEDIVAKISIEQQTVIAAVASVKQQNEDAARLLAAITSADGQAQTTGTQITNLLVATAPKIEELNTTVATGQQSIANVRTASDALAAKLMKDVSDKHNEQEASFKQLSDDITTKATALETTANKAIGDFNTVSAQRLEVAKKDLDTALQKISSDWKGEADDELERVTKRSDEFHQSESDKMLALAEQLSILELRIKDQVEKAVGFSLFNAFQRRQRFIIASKTFWRNALFAFVFAGVLCGFYFIFELRAMPTFTYAYLAKLSISLPIIYAISFCSIQYGKERRLEEEYAFKASISVSLNPYQQLVGRLVDHAVPSEREKYTDFIIRSIDAVFQSPTERVYDDKIKEEDSSAIERAAKQIGPILDPIVKIINRK